MRLKAPQAASNGHAHREKLTDVVQSHEGIAQALRNGDPSVIRDALRQHFDDGFSIPNAIPGEPR